MSRSTLKKKCHIFWFHCLPLGGSTNFRSQKLDMKTVDTMACFSDSKMSNNFVNNKAIETKSKSVVNYIAYTITRKCLNDSMTILKFLLMYLPKSTGGVYLER